ncbi:MAG TPA: hypothetical protein VK283_00275, partial [Acidimicrobiales bacterium]|nr:hypothetical protein [Acidimicrobiales bacterium]
MTTLDLPAELRDDGPGDLPPGATPQPTARPRRTRRLTREDWLALGGSLAASLALVVVGYLHILNFSGTVGFLLCWYATFIAVYAVVLAVTHPRTIVVERLVTATLYVAAAIVLFALGSTIVYTFAQGWKALAHANFFTHDMSGVAPTAPLTEGGVLHAMVGTVIEVGIAV